MSKRRRRDAGVDGRQADDPAGRAVHPLPGCSQIKGIQALEYPRLSYPSPTGLSLLALERWPSGFSGACQRVALLVGIAPGATAACMRIATSSSSVCGFCGGRGPAGLGQNGAIMRRTIGGRWCRRQVDHPQPAARGSNGFYSTFLRASAGAVFVSRVSAPGGRPGMPTPAAVRSRSTRLRQQPVIVPLDHLIRVVGGGEFSRPLRTP
jgi:hypothetical protein